MKDYSKKSVKQLEVILDRWFSQFIRLRDSDEFGMCVCCTCDKRRKWNDRIDCGHFVKRDKMMTRYDEANCAAQCRYCNHQRGGNKNAHRKYIDAKYGEGTAAELERIGKQFRMFTHSELVGMIEHYKSQVKGLMK